MNNHLTAPARARIDPTVFGVTAALVVGFLIWGLAAPDNLSAVSAGILGWITGSLGWLFILSATGFVVFAVCLALSKYGKIPLGKDGERPEYRTISWIAMMFSAGMGIGLMFFGSYGPLYHFVEAPPGMSAGDVRTAMATTMFHWGFHPWAMYAVVGLALAYSTYRLGRKQLMSAVFAPLLASRPMGPAARSSTSSRSSPPCSGRSHLWVSVRCRSVRVWPRSVGPTTRAPCCWSRSSPC